MIKNTASYGIGCHLLLIEDKYHDKVFEVVVLSKARGYLKVKVLTPDWCGVGADTWLSCADWSVIRKVHPEKRNGLSASQPLIRGNRLDKGIDGW